MGDKMDDFKSLFQETAPAEGGGFALIDKGTYEAELTEAKLDLEREPAQITFVYQITQEPYVGRKLFSNYNLSGQGIGYLKKDLDTLGLNYAEVGSPEDIVSLVWDALPFNVEIFVNQKEAGNGKTYNNTYLNAIIDPPAHVAAQTARTAPPQAASKPAPATKPASAPAAKKPANMAPQRTRQRPPTDDEIPF
jgi:hypothetical protein